MIVMKMNRRSKLESSHLVCGDNFDNIKPNQTIRQLQAQETKKQIIDSFTALISEKDFGDIGIKDICNAAGISVGAFYHHFEKKSSLLLELYQGCDEYFLNVVYPDTMGMSPVDGVFEYLHQQCIFTQKIGKESIKSFYKFQIDQKNDFFVSMTRGFSVVLTKLIERCQDIGSLTDCEKAENIAHELLILSRGIIYNWCLADGEYDMSRKVDNMCRKYLSYYSVDRN